MTIIYEEVPPLQDRILGATVIVVGRVEKAIDTITDYSTEEPQVQTIFSVKIESVIKGETSMTSIKVRVVGGKSEKTDTGWSVNMAEGDRMLLMLSPDYGPGHTDNIFVPYFTSCYKVTNEDKVKLDENVISKLGKEIELEDKAYVRLADIRSLISNIIKNKKKQEAILEKVEPEELRKMPYGEVAEVPQPNIIGPSFSVPKTESDEVER